MEKSELKILNGEYSIHRLKPSQQVPSSVFQSKFYWIGKTDEELSIVCDSKIFLESAQSESGWSIIKVNSKLDFSLVGILENLTNVLSKAGISIVALSTYDTDYLMLRTDKLETAVVALKSSGYTFAE